jgi:GTPase SAR1 family protein
MNIIVIGDPAVGKTCLLKVFSDGEFDPSHMVTIGLDYR